MTKVLTYYRTRPCGRAEPPCPRCAVSYKASVDDQVFCFGKPPGAMCVKPKLSSGGLVTCDSCKDDVQAKHYLVVVNIAPRPPVYPDGRTFGPFVLICGDGCEHGYYIGEYDPLPPPGDASENYYFLFSMGESLRVGSIPFPPDFTFHFVEDITAGDGCLQTLNLIGNENPGDTATMYPLNV